MSVFLESMHFAMRARAWLKLHRGLAPMKLATHHRTRNHVIRGVFRGKRT